MTIERTGFVYDEFFLRHDNGPFHPDSRRRLRKIVKHLEAVGLLQELRRIEIKISAKEWLERVHDPEHIERVRARCPSEGLVYGDDRYTFLSPLSFQVATLATGGALSAVEAVMAGAVDHAFCALRPPGHHAGRAKALGFCLFNHIATAARYLQVRYGLRRILIVDWDVHHGNGTQEIFYSDPSVLFFDIHQDRLYPPTGGDASEEGEGEGKGFTINIPLQAGCGDREYVQVFEETLLPAARRFRPEFVLVSAGFDAHRDDPLGGMLVTEAGYEALTLVVKRIAREFCAGRVVSVLEGGYHLGALARSVEVHLRTLSS